MNEREKLEYRFRRIFGALFFGLRKTDSAWHAFEVTWSDDDGKTMAVSDFDLHDLDRQLIGFTADGIRESLGDVRNGVQQMPKHSGDS